MIDLNVFNLAFSQVNIIEYLRSSKDVTISGLRNGLPILMLHHALYSIKVNEGTKTLSEIVKINFNNTNYFYKALVEIFKVSNVIWNRKGFNIVFPRPSKKLMEKYYLMPVFKDKVAVCVVQSVNKQLIDEFIEELNLEILENQKMEKNPTKF